MKTYDTYDVHGETVKLKDIDPLCQGYESKDAYFVWQPDADREEFFPQFNMEPEHVKDVDDWLRANGCSMDKPILIHICW